MNYAKLNTVVTSNLDYCFAGSIRDSDACEIRLAKGGRVGGNYPPDPFSVKVHFDRDFPGLKLPSLIGNTRALLILSKETSELFKQHLNLGDYEEFPFSLINHKGRVHSRDYVFFNPLGTYDVAAPESDFVRYPDGGIYACKRWVMVASKLSEVPDILRPAEVPKHYLVSQRLVDLVDRFRLSNFEFQPVACV